MHRAVHRRDRREVDDLHVAPEPRVPHDLSGGACVDGDDLGVSQVEDVAAVEELVLWRRRRVVVVVGGCWRGKKSEFSLSLSLSLSSKENNKT